MKGLEVEPIGGREATVRFDLEVHAWEDEAGNDRSDVDVQPGSVRRMADGARWRGTMCGCWRRWLGMWSSG